MGSPNWLRPIIAAAMLAMPPLVAQEAKAASDRVDGNTLLSECRESSSGYIWCAGYVLGVAEMVAESGFKGTKACFPENASTRQLVKVTLKYVDDNPDVLDLSAHYLVTLAVIKTFPCKKGSKAK